jgi:hypothetical protein
VVILQPNSDDENLERVWAEALSAEVAALSDRGVRVDVIAADVAARAAMGDDPMSGAGAPPAVATGRASAQQILAIAAT